MGCRCCGPCFLSQGNHQFETPCCTCIPKRICVAIYPPAALSAYCECSEAPEDDPYGPLIRMTLHLDCTGQRNTYTGSFICGTGDDSRIDLSFRFESEENSFDPCYFVLESEALGYTYALPVDGYPATDNRLKVLMGGAYGTDIPTRREECLSGGPFEFSIDLSSRREGCGEARVVVSAADFMAKPEPTPEATGVRPCSCVCMNMILFLAGEEHKLKVCFDSDNNCWTGLYELGLFESYLVTVYLESYGSGNSVVEYLRMESSFGDGEQVLISCDECDDTMYAEWSGLAYDARVRVFCDRSDNCPACDIPCLDCKCFCRCVCVIYASELEQVATVVNACWDEYLQEWTADVGARVLHFKIICDGTTGTTQIDMTDQDGHRLGIDETSGGAPQAANCPDITTTWVINEYGNTTTAVTLVCDNCGECSNLIMTPCCEVPVPPVIYATVTGVQSCWQYVIDPEPVLTPIPTLIIPLILHPAIIGGFPYWEGTKQIDGHMLDQGCNASNPSVLGYTKITIRVLCGVEIDSVDFQCFGPDNSFLGASPIRVPILPGSGPYNTCYPVHITAKLGDPSNYMTGGISIQSGFDCRPDGSGGDNRGYFFDIVVTE